MHVPNSIVEILLSWVSLKFLLTENDRMLNIILLHEEAIHQSKLQCAHFA